MPGIDILEVEVVIVQALWLILPAYLPNSCAVLFGGGTPVDFGKKYKDNRRIFGDGKTWYGLIGGILSGISLGILQIFTETKVDYQYFVGFGQFSTAVIIIILIPIGAMLGDLLGSFVKRRFDMPRGAKIPILDQYDFIIGAWLLILIFNWNWFFERFIYDVHIFGLIFILLLTPLLHRISNIIGYKLGKKKEPW